MKAFEEDWNIFYSKRQSTASEALWFHMQLAGKLLGWGGSSSLSQLSSQSFKESLRTETLISSVP